MENSTPAAPSSGGLKRTFGLREAITITAGPAIGVGLFTTGANVVGNLGPAIIIAAFIALAATLYPSLLYAEMGFALPYAGDTYEFASLALGRSAGVLAGWCCMISLVTPPSSGALAFSYYFKTGFFAFDIDLPVSDVVLALILTAVFVTLNVFGVKLTGRLQNVFVFFF